MKVANQVIHSSCLFKFCRDFVLPVNRAAMLDRERRTVKKLLWPEKGVLPRVLVGIFLVGGLHR